MEHTRAARLGVGASYVAHSDVNSALALGGKISGGIKRARAQKLEHEDAEVAKGWGATDDHEDSKCASIKRKHGAVSELLPDAGSLKKKKKKKKKSTTTAAETAPAAPVILKPVTSHSQKEGATVAPQKQLLLQPKDTTATMPAAAIKQPRQIISNSETQTRANDASEPSCNESSAAASAGEDLGSGLRNFHLQGMRKRTKTRSKAKNLKKDKRPPELRPGGEKCTAPRCAFPSVI